MNPEMATGAPRSKKIHSARWSEDWKRGSRAILATATRQMRASTRFHRRIVMNRTSTMSENAEPTTTSANTPKPRTGFQSHSTVCAAWGSTSHR
jgi:hypothetical protein